MTAIVRSSLAPHCPMGRKMRTMKMSQEQAPTPRAQDQDTGSVDSLWRRPGRKFIGRQELQGEEAASWGWVYKNMDFTKKELSLPNCTSVCKAPHVVV